jgi:hypothetical protein
VASWVVAWSGPEPFRYHTFFPLWLGYIIAIDGLAQMVSGTSLIQRLRFRFLWFFAISIPIWWLFEAANDRLENWRYVVPHEYSWLAYHAEASLDFSTVVPAIFVTAELVRSTVMQRPIRWIRIDPGPEALGAISGLGAALFTATMFWPDLLFPFVWISLFLFVDPIVRSLGGRAISRPLAAGRWDPIVVLFLATLICGFFWEMWNSRSMPKWTYQIDYADWLRVFEMPLLGYGGYLPFGLEVFSLVMLADCVFRLGLSKGIRFDRNESE